MVDLGVMFRCQKPPEALRGFARRVEAGGFDELWIVEDCFFGGGIASVASALAYTERIRVGLGIVPAVVRNAAFTAMEFATLARLYPGRFLPGIGHGVGAWMEQVGAFPPSQLVALEEVTRAVRALLHGETVTLDGDYVHLDKVKLDFAPEEAPPVQLGVRGPKSLFVSGRAADGTILSEGSAPVYVRWAREQIAQGQTEAGHKRPHRMTVYVWTSIDPDREKARARLRPTVAHSLPRMGPRLEALGIREEMTRVMEEHGAAGFAAALPERWLEALTVSGSVEDCAASARRFAEAGVDSLVFVLPHEDEDAQLAQLERELLPRLRASLA